MRRTRGRYRRKFRASIQLCSLSRYRVPPLASAGECCRHPRSVPPPWFRLLQWILITLIELSRSEIVSNCYLTFSIMEKQFVMECKSYFRAISLLCISYQLLDTAQNGSFVEYRITHETKRLLWAMLASVSFFELLA